MAPTYTKGSCADDGTKEGVTFSVGTSSVLKNGDKTSEKGKTICKVWKHKDANCYN